MERKRSSNQLDVDLTERDISQRSRNEKSSELVEKKKRRNEVEKINSCTRTSIFIIHTRGNVLAINPPFSVKQSSLIFLVMCLSVCVCAVLFFLLFFSFFFL